MGKILCATRGGEAGIRTQDAAISKAKETNDALVFLYIYDMEFMAHANYALNPDIVSDELDHMAEFLMTMAVERAKKKGVQASYLVRQGDFDSELASVAKEEEATLVVLGRPGEDESHFALENLKELAEKLQTETGIAFCVLPESLK